MSKHRHESASPSGGLILIDEENTRSVLLEIIKSLGRKLMHRKFMDIMNISRPASISSPLTHLEAIPRDFVFSEYLDRAALTPDPVRRLQLITTFIVTSLHINPVQMKNKPPLNPLLGETYHIWKEDGTQIWIEQTSTHPPVAHWQMVGRDNLFQFVGHGQLLAGLVGPNTLLASKQGKNNISFSDGGAVEYSCPKLQISGLVYGERTVNFVGSCSVEDAGNKLRCEIEFGGHNGVLNWLTSWWSKPLVLSDYFTATIKQYSENSNSTVEIAKGGGSWLEYVQFGREVLWHMGLEPAVPWILDEAALPSDSRFRADLTALIANDLEEAQLEKEDAENRQGRDRALRGK